MINGNIEGIRQSILDEMENLYEADMETLRHEFISHEVMDALAGFTERINREISVYIARDGMVMDVTIGQHDRVGLPELRVRRGVRRLSGIRCIHTHPGGDSRLSAVDISTLKRMHFDAMASLGVREGKVTGLQAAFLTNLLENGDYEFQTYGPYHSNEIPHDLLLDAITTSAADVGSMANMIESLEKKEERVILIGIDSLNSLEELARLADTAGAKVLSLQLQKSLRPDASTYIGRGKVSELALLRQAMEADIIIADDELSGAQIRNLERDLGCRVIDRTALILDIFAGRATTYEGKLQVALAQYKYMLPRLSGNMGVALSRLGGGIGTRGPGESKLETDRRRIRRRIYELGSQVDQLQKERSLRRRARQKNAIPVVAIVGYTNSGKSTLLNRLASSDVMAEDKLFATLDPVTRRVALPRIGEVLFTDTVGFINKLPHDLVDAFRSTLEEVTFADVILHVVDGSTQQMQMQYRVAENVLASLGAVNAKRVVAFNKTDLRTDSIMMDTSGAPVVDISALTGEGIDLLLTVIENVLQTDYKTVTFVIPYDKGGILSEFHEKTKILKQEYVQEGVQVEAIVSSEYYNKYKDLIYSQEGSSANPHENPEN